MHAHNYYLQTWVEQGLLGFIALIALIAVGMWLGVYYLKTMKGEQQKIVFGAFWCFAAQSVHCLVYAGPSSYGGIILWVALGLMAAAGQANTRTEPFTANKYPNPRLKFVPPSNRFSYLDFVFALRWLFWLILCIPLSIFCALWVNADPDPGIYFRNTGGFVTGHGRDQQLPKFFSFPEQPLLNYLFILHL